MQTIAYLGPEGTFSEEAARKYILDREYTLVPLSTIYDVITGVDSGSVTHGIVPIENSVEGVVNATLDVLVRTKNVLICEEIDLPIEHNLIVQKGTRLSDITDVYSHYQPIGQCTDFLRKRLPRAVVHGTNSTAEAVAVVAGYQGADKVPGAIGTRKAAQIYNLDIVAGNINDYPDTITRFVVLGKEAQAPTGADKTSIAFTTHADRPGGLYEILGVFASRSINLTKIESRPSKEALGHYIFFLDMEGHKDSTPVKDALAGMKEFVLTMKILGSYPVKR